MIAETAPALLEDRAIDPSDQACLHEFLMRCPDYFHRLTGQFPCERHARQIVDEAVQWHAAGLGVYRQYRTQGGTLIGISTAHFIASPVRTYDLGLLLIRPEYRGQGWGTTIMARIVTAARMQRCKRIALKVMLDNPHALSFWRKQGFVEMGDAGTEVYGQVAHASQKMALDI